MTITYCGNPQVWCNECEHSCLDLGPGNRICEECYTVMTPATREQLISEGCAPEDIEEIEETEEMEGEE